MSTTIHERLIELLASSNADFRTVEHQPCRTSEESAFARASGGAPNSVGAKAIVARQSKEGGFFMLVLPGFARVDSKAVRRLIGSFSFASVDEIADATGGLERGAIPPFGAPLFPLIGKLIVDPSIGMENCIGFNAGLFDKSVIMSGKAYLSVVPNAVVDRIVQAD